MFRRKDIHKVIRRLNRISQRFGLAFFNILNVEHHMRILILFEDLFIFKEKKGLTEKSVEEWKKQDENKFKKLTGRHLGKLYKMLKFYKRYGDNEEFMDMLEYAGRLRQYLAHHFYTANMESLLNDEICQSLVEKLDKYGEEMADLALILTDLELAFFADIGDNRTIELFKKCENDFLLEIAAIRKKGVPKKYRL